MGLLRITGTIDLSQFWPEGEADADTTKVRVAVGPNAFEFAPDDSHFKKTSVFTGAEVRGTKNAPVIDNKGRITVRLQGIDAPELHYQAGALKKSSDVTDAKRKKFNTNNKVKRRQYLAESGTVALAKMLSRINPANVKCQVLSFVDRPTEVVDTYGRFVGNIRVGTGYGTDMNTWLTEKGWVYPTFYSSMSRTEINGLLDAMERGRREQGRVWDHYSTDASKFDPNLVYRGKGVGIDAAADKGPVLMPKLFRRQVAYRMQKSAGVFQGSFKAFLEKNRDRCFELKRFLKDGVHTADERNFDEFMVGSDFQIEPQEVVFKEKFSKLVDKNGDELEEF